jgi:hypothetical protein
MPGGHHHGTADVHLESVEGIRHGKMHTVSLLTINIALAVNFSQVLKQIFSAENLGLLSPTKPAPCATTHPADPPPPPNPHHQESRRARNPPDFYSRKTSARCSSGLSGEWVAMNWSMLVGSSQSQLFEQGRQAVGGLLHGGLLQEFGGWIIREQARSHRGTRSTCSRRHRQKRYKSY